MTFIQAITVFFESVFKRSSPEAQKRAFMRKIDIQIREFKPVICKNGTKQLISQHGKIHICVPEFWFSLHILKMTKSENYRCFPC